MKWLLGDKPVSEVHLGVDGGNTILLWKAKPVEVIPKDASWSDAKNWLRDTALPKYGLHHNSVTEYPFDLDASQVSSLAQMFMHQDKLVVAPKIINSERVTNMDAMFYGCQSLTFVPDLRMDSVTTCTEILRNCQRLTDGSVRLIRPDGTKPRGSYMIVGSGLTREPFFRPDGTPIN